MFHPSPYAVVLLTTSSCAPRGAAIRFSSTKDLLLIRLLLSEPNSVIDRHNRRPSIKPAEVDAMNKNQPTRPVEEGVYPSNEKIFLDRLKTADKGKKTAAPWSEVKKRMPSSPLPRR